MIALLRAGVPHGDMSLLLSRPLHDQNLCSPRRTKSPIFSVPASVVATGAAASLVRQGMAGPRYSHHLRAEEAAASMEALIRDYEYRGRRLRVRGTGRASPMLQPRTDPLCCPSRHVKTRS